MAYPITFWYGIPKKFISPERLEEARNAGFNIIECRYDTETNLKVLKWCEELGLKAFVFDSRMYSAVNGSEGWEQNLLSMIDDYKDYPALERWFVQDEPVDDLFPALGRVAAFMREHDKKHSVYINLLPLPAVLPYEKYDGHVEGFLSTVKPDLLSYDHYNLMKREADKRGELPEAAVSEECRIRNHWEDKYFEAWDRESFYDNLEIIREKAAKYNIPWSLIVLLVEHWHYRRPTEGEIRWEVFTSYAYGSSLLSYFTYWTPDVDHHEPWSYHHGIIQADGTPDANYGIVRKINAEIQNVTSALNGAKPARVYHIGQEKSEIFIKPFEAIGELSGIRADALVIGCFDNGMFMAVNKRHHSDQIAEFVIPEGKKLQVLMKSSGRWLDTDAKVTISEGDGDLFRIINSMEKLKLVIPDESYFDEIKAYRAEFLDAGSSMDGAGPLRRMENPAEWLEKIRYFASLKDYSDKWVKTTQFLYVRESDNRVVGMIQLRHFLNEFLEKYSGHIGYCVRPSERRKGYAKAMLRDILPYCRECGLEKIMIACLVDNDASRKTIIANGGIYQQTVFCEPDGVNLEQYIIKVTSENKSFA